MNLDQSDKPSRINRINLLVGAVFLFFMAIVVVFLGWGSASIPFIHHILGEEFVIYTLLIGVFLTTTIIFWSRHRGYFDPFEFPIWISLNVYLFIPLNVLIDTNIQIYIPWLRNTDRALWGRTTILFGVGLCFMWIGYILVYQYISRKNIPTPENRILRPRFAFVIWSLSSLVSIIGLASGVQGYLPSQVGFVWENYLTIIQFLGWAAWSALLFYHLSKPTKIGWFWIAISLSTGMAISFITGTRSVAYWLIYIIMHIFYLKRKISIRWLILAAFGFFLFIPTVNSTRTVFQSLARGGDISFLQRVSAVNESFSSQLNTAPSSLIDQTVTTISARQASIFQISASVMFIHPSKTPYVGNEIATNLLYQFIPRIFWPSKPVGDSSIYNINDLYFGYNTLGLSAIGIFADSYRAAGWFFVVIFFVIFGAGLALLYWQGPARGSNYGTVFYLTMLVWVVLYERTILALIVFCIEHGLIIYLFTRFFLFGPDLKQGKND